MHSPARPTGTEERGNAFPGWRQDKALIEAPHTRCWEGEG